MILKKYFEGEIAKYKNIEIKFQVKICRIEQQQDQYVLYDDAGKNYATAFLLNATYASTNQILDLVGYEKFDIKYELCEIILCEVNERLKSYGITVMDGPFFSIMPFGKTGLHSLTAVTFTPHMTSYESLPTFSCQEKCNGNCTNKHLGNCNGCIAKPKSAFPYMEHLARKYLKDNLEFTYKESLFSMKPILMSSELDDSRPTVIKVFSKNPTVIGVLSGKINTVYDLDKVLDEI